MKWLCPLLLLCLCLACKKSDSPVTATDVLTGNSCSLKLYGITGSGLISTDGTTSVDLLNEVTNTSTTATTTRSGLLTNSVTTQTVIVDNTYYIVSFHTDSTHIINRSLDRINISDGNNKSITLSLGINDIDYYKATNTFYAITDTSLISFQIAADTLSNVIVLATIPWTYIKGQHTNFTGITVDQSTGNIYLVSQQTSYSYGIIANFALYKYDGTILTKLMESNTEQIYAPRFNQNDGKIYCFDFNYISSIDLSSRKLSHLVNVKNRVGFGSFNYCSAVIDLCNNAYVLTTTGDITSQSINFYGIYNCGNHKLYFTSGTDMAHLGLAITQ